MAAGCPLRRRDGEIPACPAPVPGYDTHSPGTAGGFARDMAVTHFLGQFPLKILALAVLGVPWGYTACAP